MNTLHKIGFALFLSALSLFVGVFFLGSYKLDQPTFNEVIKPEHLETLSPAFSDILDKTYVNAISFSNAVDSKIADINDYMREQQAWDKIIYDDYTSTLTRAATKGLIVNKTSLLFFLIFGGGFLGALLYIIPESKLKGSAGIKNNHVFTNALNNRGWIGILLGTALIVFYILLYFYPAYITNWIILVQPMQSWFNPGATSGQWFLYGLMYCFAVLVMGVRMIIKYRHSNYQIVRTCSVIFFQLAIAYTLPEILVRLNQPYFDFKNMWPLDYDFFDAWHIKTLTSAGGLGIFMLVWGITLFLIGVPVFTYFFGKRWYCSWVCGCGGLAETAGDPFRQLSDKSLKAWKIERYLIHAVLVFSVVMTIALIYNFATGTNSILGIDTYNYLRKPYGFFVGSIFSGVVGTGFYPLMGNRVWCRFGCPLAAYLGIIQRFKSRFRITTNGGQCISCGNCSTYCEQGIDVRWYAQRGQNIVRSSCVGCGVCSAVCPRGVLNLENTDEKGRLGKAELIGNDSKI